MPAVIVIREIACKQAEMDIILDDKFHSVFTLGEFLMCQHILGKSEGTTQQDPNTSK
jgi:hypothetical protein